MAEWFAYNALALALALVLDAVFGEPDWLWRRLPHPIVLIGRLIGTLDRRMNRETESPRNRRVAGILALFLLLAIVGGASIAATYVAYLAHPLLALALSTIVGAVLLAQRSLHKHVAAVYTPLFAGDLGDARQALSMIVGRKTDALDEEGIARAALESLAENHSDGVISPAFWMVLGGLPGIALYKAINTADSVIGYKTERHLHFGWASAKLDDGVNWLPARLSVLLVTLSVAMTRLSNQRHAFRWPDWAVIRRDAPTHASPNAGWPEAGYATALGIALGGPRAYPGHTVDAPYIYPEGRRALTASDIRAGLALFRATCAVTFLVVVLVAAAIGFAQSP